MYNVDDDNENGLKTHERCVKTDDKNNDDDNDHGGDSSDNTMIAFFARSMCPASLLPIHLRKISACSTTRCEPSLSASLKIIRM